MQKHTKIIALNGGEDTHIAMEKAQKTRVFTPKSRQMSLEIADSGITAYLGAEPFDITDSVIFNRYPTDAHFCGILLEHAEILGSTLLNQASLSYRRSTEKTAQMSRMANADIPVPHSFVVHIKTFETILPVVEEKLAYPIVCKVDGIRGEKVVLANNRSEVEQFVEQFDQSELCVFQKFIKNDGDVRIICAHGEYLGAIKRIGDEDQFLNNYAQGARVERYEPTDEEIALSLKACEVNQFDFAGVDVMHTVDGPRIIEVNMGPGLTGFESIHGEHTTLAKFVDILHKADYL